jgi:hypothetical protein
VIDPLGNIPFFLTALKSVAPERQNRFIIRELLVAYGVMVAFLFAGKPLLDLLRISEPALTIAGGVILFLIALRMRFPPPGRSLHEEVEGEPFIVPLAIPYFAGPSVLATELLLMSREPQRWGSWLIALSLAWAATAAIPHARQQGPGLPEPKRHDRHRAPDGHDPGRACRADVSFGRGALYRPASAERYSLTSPMRMANRTRPATS